jgi:hypothetical protein
VDVRGRCTWRCREKKGREGGREKRDGEGERGSEGGEREGGRRKGEREEKGESHVYH